MYSAVLLCNACNLVRENTEYDRIQYFAEPASAGGITRSYLRPGFFIELIEHKNIFMATTIITVLLLLKLILYLQPQINGLIVAIAQKIKSRIRLGKKPASLFDDHFIEPKSFYLDRFRKLPCISYIGNVNATELYKLIKSGKYGAVKSVYQRNFYSWQDKRMEFSKTLFVLERHMVVKLGDDWAEIYYDRLDNKRVNEMWDDFVANKAPEKENDYEINIISMSGNSLDLKTLAIKTTALDIDLYYNDDFRNVDTLIREALMKENSKGIVLLHGLPGTGKTTYLRSLIGSLKKKVLFVSPAVAGNLMNPEFMDLLIDNPNSVLVIEDAENIIMDRRYSSHSSVSNLLNISDGLLSDCLNVQIICTFNSAVSMVDTALLRKGRLIARYEFDRLSIEKAKMLSDHLGLKQVIDKPMTLAEISNPGEDTEPVAQTTVIGFRREAWLEN